MLEIQQVTKQKSIQSGCSLYQLIWKNVLTNVDDVIYCDFDTIITQSLYHDVESGADVQDVNHYCSSMNEEDGEPSLQPAQVISI
jgi:lipopolysaccharide biosynthesis glycosyltransferase